MASKKFRNAKKVTVFGVHSILPANVWVDVCDIETGEVYAMTDEDNHAVLNVIEWYDKEEVMLAKIVKMDLISSQRVTLWVSLYKG